MMRRTPFFTQGHEHYTFVLRLLSYLMSFCVALRCVALRCVALRCVASCRAVHCLVVALRFATSSLFPMLALFPLHLSLHLM